MLWLALECVIHAYMPNVRNVGLNLRTLKAFTHIRDDHYEVTYKITKLQASKKTLSD